MGEKIKLLFNYLTNTYNYDITIDDIEAKDSNKFIVNGNFFDIYSEDEFDEILKNSVDDEFNYFEDCITSYDELRSAYNYGIIKIDRDKIIDKLSYMDDCDVLDISCKRYDWVAFEDNSYLIIEE